VPNVAKANPGPAGFQVDLAGDGIEAIAAVSADPDRFVAVMLDLTMPRLSGAETFARSRGPASDPAHEV